MRLRAKYSLLMPSHRMLAGLIFMSSLPSYGQDRGIATVYAPGGLFRGTGRSAIKLGIGHNDAASNGNLFDGDDKVVFLAPGRFASVELTPGTHKLSASANNKPDPENQLSVDVKAGERYFFRVTTTSKGASIVQVYKDHLDAVSCAQAREEADTTKPVDIKRVDKEWRAHLVNEAYFPRCQ